MERFAEILATLADETQVAALSTDDLATLRTELRALAAQVIAGEVETDDDVASLSSIADHVEGIDYVEAVRVADAEAHAEALAAQVSRLGLSDPEPDPVVEEAPVEAPAPALAEVPALPTPAPVAAAPVAAPALSEVPVMATPAPEAAPLPALSLVSPPAANAPAVTTEPRIMRLRDRQYVDVDDLVSTIMESREAFMSMGGDAVERVPLGRISTAQFGTDRSLTGVDERTANSRLRSELGNAWQPDRWTDALVASGGFCAPAAPDYSIPVLAGSQRPVAGYLPSFNAERGRVIVITPPTLATIATSTSQTAGSAVSVWTNTVDTTPGGTTKPVQTVACPANVTIETQAIVQQLKFGNMLTKADPELVKAWVELTAAAWARRAEGQLLSQISGFSTSLTTTQVLGATNDFAGYLRQAAAGVRSRQRMPYNARLRALIPAWFIDLVGADLAHNHPGDGLDRFTQDQEGFVRAMFNAANVNVTFYEDSTDGGTNQLFSTPTGGADLPNFPPGPASTSARVVWYLFPEGTFARADAGTLDLGVVRDSTLNGTNDYEMFAESWEAVVPHVVESFRITSTICATGSGAIDVTSAAYCTQS